MQFSITSLSVIDKATEAISVMKLIDHSYPELLTATMPPCLPFAVCVYINSSEACHFMLEMTDRPNPKFLGLPHTKFQDFLDLKRKFKFIHQY